MQKQGQYCKYFSPLKQTNERITKYFKQTRFYLLNMLVLMSVNLICLFVEVIVNLQRAFSLIM